MRRSVPSRHHRTVAAPINSPITGDAKRPPQMARGMPSNTTTATTRPQAAPEMHDRAMYVAIDAVSFSLGSLCRSNSGYVLSNLLEIIIGQA